MSAVGDAEKTLIRHAADENGWCAFHLRYFELHVPAGTCSAFLMAAQFIRNYRREQAQRMRVVFAHPKT
jgi:hypothetical protein